MKRSLSIIIVALVCLFAASCQNDDNVGREVTVAFVAEIPAGMATKAYSSGHEATTLHYAVYGEGETTVIDEGTRTFENLWTTVDLTLIVGKRYDIIFWAQNPTAPYTFDSATQSVNIDYTNVKANDEKLDAFYKAVTDYVVEGPKATTVMLTRPFAQINVCTDDEEEAAVSRIWVEQSSMTVSGVYSKLNLKDGSASNPVDVTFGMADIPKGDNDKILVKGESDTAREYGYMQMNYILVPAEPTTHTVTFSLKTNEHTIDYLPVSNIPKIQRNYRYNLYGSLLTKPTVWEVEIDTIYEIPSYNEKYK